MLIKTNELKGAALDWAVCISEGFKASQLYISKSHYTPSSIYTRTFDDDGNPDGYLTGTDRMYSCKWAAGGPLIERERISVGDQTHIEGHPEHSAWYATNRKGAYGFGTTPLEAAMRCYVASKLGDEVEIPKELC